MSKIRQLSDESIRRPGRLRFNENHETIADGQSKVVVNPIDDVPLGRNDFKIVFRRLDVFVMESAIKERQVVLYAKQTPKNAVLRRALYESVVLLSDARLVD